MVLKCLIRNFFVDDILNFSLVSVICAWLVVLVIAIEIVYKLSTYAHISGSATCIGFETRQSFFIWCTVWEVYEAFICLKMVAAYVSMFIEDLYLYIQNLSLPLDYSVLSFITYIVSRFMKNLYILRLQLMIGLWLLILQTIYSKL